MLVVALVLVGVQSNFGFGSIFRMSPKQPNSYSVLSVAKPLTVEKAQPAPAQTKPGPMPPGPIKVLDSAKINRAAK